LELRLIWYFVTQVVYIPFVWGTYLLKGPGPVYGFIYCAFTAFVLVTVFGIAWEAVSRRMGRWEAVGLAFLLTEVVAGRALVGIPKPLSWYLWAVWGEGALLMWAGIILCGAAWYRRKRLALIMLGVYWICQAVFDFGFCLAWPRWAIVNLWVPPAMGAFAFSLILWKLLSRETRRDLLMG
jgi:hypothetical protein